MSLCGVAGLIISPDVDYRDEEHFSSFFLHSSISITSQSTDQLTANTAAVLIGSGQRTCSFALRRNPV